MSFSDLSCEIVLLVSSLLSTADLNSLHQVNRGLAELLTAQLFDRAVPPARCPSKPVLPWAAERGCERLTTYLLDRNVDFHPPGYANPTNNPMQLAAQHGHAAVISIFLRRLPETSSKYLAPLSQGPTPIDLAAEYGHLDVVELLLTQPYSRSLSTPLGKATANGYTSVVALLLPHVSSTELSRPLEIAAGHGHTDIVKLLLPSAPTANLHAALENAAVGGHKDTVEVLLPNVPNTQLAAALRGAVNNGWDEITRLLLMHMDDDLRPAAASAILAVAVKQGDLDSVNVLIAAGARGSACVGTKWVATLLHWIAEFACMKMFYENRRLDGIAAVLAANGGNVRAVDTLMKTPLHIAAGNGPAALKRSLRVVGPDVAEKYNVAARVHYEVMVVLVGAGVDVNARDYHGRTPLHLAAENGDVDTVKFLLDMMADTGIVDKRGRTPRESAMRVTRRAGVPEVVCFIKDFEQAVAISLGQSE